MKILDIPQSGKRGLNVSQARQFGQISRALAIPSQRGVRSILGRVAARLRVLQETQRAAWVAAAVDAPPAQPQFPGLSPQRLACRYMARYGEPPVAKKVYGRANPSSWTGGRACPLFEAISCSPR